MLCPTRLAASKAERERTENRRASAARASLRASYSLEQLIASNAQRLWVRPEVVGSRKLEGHGSTVSRVLTREIRVFPP